MGIITLCRFAETVLVSLIHVCTRTVIKFHVITLIKTTQIHSHSFEFTLLLTMPYFQDVMAKFKPIIPCQRT